MKRRMRLCILQEQESPRPTPMPTHAQHFASSGAQVTAHGHVAQQGACAARKYLLCALNLEDADGTVVIFNVQRICSIIHNDGAILLREVNQLLQLTAGRSSPCGVVGRAEEDEVCKPTSLFARCNRQNPACYSIIIAHSSSGSTAKCM
jgi:hypothetical protein